MMPQRVALPPQRVGNDALVPGEEQSRKHQPGQDEISQESRKVDAKAALEADAERIQGQRRDRPRPDMP